MARPRTHENEADRSRAYRERKAEREQQARAEHDQLQLSVRRLRQAYAVLPASLKGSGDAGYPNSITESIDQVSVFLESLAALYPGSVPDLTQGETKTRRK